MGQKGTGSRIRIRNTGLINKFSHRLESFEFFNYLDIDLGPANSEIIGLSNAQIKNSNYRTIEDRILKNLSVAYLVTFSSFTISLCARIWFFYIEVGTEAIPSSPVR